MTTSPLPPHDADAERALLGSLLLGGDIIVLDMLAPTDFYRPAHGWVYEAMVAVTKKGEPIDQITVANALAGSDRLVSVGGQAFLLELTMEIATGTHAEHYARIVADKASQRHLISVAAEIARIGSEGSGGTSGERYAAAEAALTKVRRSGTSTDFVHIRDVIATLLQFPDEETTHTTKAAEMRRIPTGYSGLDSLLSGFARGALVTIAARPGMGKTSLLLGIARNVAVRHKARVALFSLEMSQEELAQRLLSAEAGVNLQTLMQGGVSPSEKDAMWLGGGVLSGAEILISDASALTEVDMRAKARRLHKEAPLDLIVVDYLQLMSANKGSRGNRVEQVSEITRALKSLARELNVPVLAASQLNRAVEQRVDHKPQLSDLRESGSIEQDSDVVLFIHREDKYFTSEEWSKTFPARPYPQNIATMIVAKHRNGPTGERALFFRETFAKFESMQWE